jgi:hypothetical protein
MAYTRVIPPIFHPAPPSPFWLFWLFLWVWLAGTLIWLIRFLRLRPDYPILRKDEREQKGWLMDEERE